MKRLIRILFILTLLTTLVSSQMVFADGHVDFSDLDESHWSYPYVEFMVENGIVSGYPDGTFRPNDPFSRAAFATLLYKSFELSPAIDMVPYKDLDASHWAYDYIQGATNYLTYYEMDDGIYFDPTAPSVREDVAVAMVVTAGIDEMYYPDHKHITDFTDYDEISPQLRDYVALAVELGIMSGSGDEFRPQATLSRAEACTVFAKYAMDVKGTLGKSEKVKTVPGQNKMEEKPMDEPPIDTMDDTMNTTTNDTMENTDMMPHPEPVVEGGYYKLKEVIVEETGAYYNSETEWKKVIEHSDGYAVVQAYDHDFDRGMTSDSGYDIQGTIRWSGIPEYIVPNEQYNLLLTLDLTKNDNPEEGYIGVNVGAFDLHLNPDNTAYHGVWILDANGKGTLEAGLPKETGTDMGGKLNLIYNAPGPKIDRIAIKIDSGDAFYYMYVYEWNE